MGVNISIPEDLYNKAQEIAKKQGVSGEEIVVSMFKEQLAAWERLQQRAARGSRDKFLAVLDKVPDVEPEEYDRT